MSALVVGWIDHHGQPLILVLCQLLGDQVIEHARKERSLEVGRIEASAAHHHALAGDLRYREERRRNVVVTVGAL